jgi:hypothetical protein
VRKTFPIAPAHPERVCWGCDRYCAADDLACGNGSERTQHPMELFGDDWVMFGLDAVTDRSSGPAGFGARRS